jgi:hypothetical protein
VENANAQENVHAVDPETVDFAVLLLRTKEGVVGMQRMEGMPEANGLDDIYSLVSIIKRNIEAQHSAAVLMNVVNQIQSQQEGRTDSGLIVPK